MHLVVFVRTWQPGQWWAVYTMQLGLYLAAHPASKGASTAEHGIPNGAHHDH